MKLSRLAFALCLLSGAAFAQGARQEDARGEALMNEGRFAEAQVEIEFAKNSGVYDAFIVNDDLEIAIDQVCDLVRARRRA